MFKSVTIAFSIAICLLLSSCANLHLIDFFSGYAQQMAPVRQAQLAGDLTKARVLLPQNRPSHNNYTLTQLELGRLNFLLQDWPASQQAFDTAWQDIEQERQKAKLQISKGLQTAGTTLSNDNTLKYQVPAYEQSMLHSYQALNYLYQGYLESALVEIRRANLVQEQALRDNESAVINAKEKMTRQGIDTSSLASAYPSMDGLIGTVKNGFQNAYTFYLSATLYEAAGELNDAYIDFKRAIEIFPDNRYLQQDVLRLASRLGMSDELEQFKQRFGPYQENAHDSGYLVIFYEQNLINSKQEVAVALPIFTQSDDMRFFSFALPVYRQNNEHRVPLLLNANGKHYASEKIVQIQSLAAKALKDNIPALITRQVVRVVAKEQMRKKLAREGGDVGNILAGLYNIASEKADTRSWLTLPGTIGIVKIPLPAGKHSITAQHTNGSSPLTVNIRKGKTTLVNVVTAGQLTNIHTVNI